MRERERGREGERDRDRERERQRDRDRETETETETHRETDSHRKTDKQSVIPALPKRYPVSDAYKTVIYNQRESLKKRTETRKLYFTRIVV